MGCFQFLHAADLHLDTPFQGLSRLDPSLGEHLRDASLDAFDALIDLALDRNVAFVLFAGDIYDGADRGVRSQLRFRSGLQRLSNAGIFSYVIYGNHDPLNGWSAIRAMPSGVTEFGGEQVTSVPVKSGETTIATVHGISYLTAATTENLVLRFGDSDGEGLQIGLLHANVGDSTEHGSYSPCSLEDLNNRGIDYWALGHIHKRQVLQEHNPKIVYPGCLQGRSPKPSDRAAKGVYLVSAEGRRIVELEFVPLDRARFVAFEIDASHFNDLPQLSDELHRLACDALNEAEGRTLLGRVVIKGRTPLHDDLQRSGVLQDLTAQLREQAPGGAARFWWDRIVDETRSEIDLEAIRARDDFLSAVIGTTELLQEDRQSLDCWMDEVLATGKRRQVSQLVLSDLESEQLRTELLSRAMKRAIDLLESHHVTGT